MGRKLWTTIMFGSWRKLIIHFEITTRPPDLPLLMQTYSERLHMATPGVWGREVAWAESSQSSCGPCKHAILSAACINSSCDELCELTLLDGCCCGTVWALVNLGTLPHLAFAAGQLAAPSAHHADGEHTHTHKHTRRHTHIQTHTDTHTCITCTLTCMCMSQ